MALSLSGEGPRLLHGVSRGPVGPPGPPELAALLRAGIQRPLDLLAAHLAREVRVGAWGQGVPSARAQGGRKGTENTRCERVYKRRPMGFR
jgi:hypothetical protein